MNSSTPKTATATSDLRDKGRTFWNANSVAVSREELRRVYDGWLESNGALAAIATATPNGDALELGAGSGVDALHLAETGFRVTACDFAPNAVANLRRNIPECTAVEVDLAREFPFSTAAFDLVIANKSLHYFSERRTFALFAEIWRVLRTGGVFAFIVNSLSEYRGGGRQIEENFYEFRDDSNLVSAEPPQTKPSTNSPNKRFFDALSLRHFLSANPWQILTTKLQIERTPRLQILHPSLSEKTTYLAICRKTKTISN